MEGSARPPTGGRGNTGRGEKSHQNLGSRLWGREMEGHDWLAGAVENWEIRFISSSLNKP